MSKRRLLFSRAAPLGRRLRGLSAAVALMAMIGVPALAQDQSPQDRPDQAPAGSITHQMYLDMKLGKLNIHGDNVVVEALVLQRDIPISYDYIATLMRTPNAFGEGPACIVCHGSNDPAKSYRGLDLSTCEGILRGSTEIPSRPIVQAGDAHASLLVQMVRNNRMPLGVPFFTPVDSPSILKIKDWIDAGANADEHFTQEILPLFSEPEAFGSDTACIECHKSFRDPPSFNEVNLTSHEAIMQGAFSKTRKKQGLPRRPIVIPGNAEDSPLYRRLTKNRMPPGIDPGEPSDHPNTLLLMRWVEQGVWCK